MDAEKQNQCGCDDARQKCVIMCKGFTQNVQQSVKPFYQPAAHKVPGQLVLRLLYIFCICLSIGLCVPTYHMHNNYVTYIVATQVYFS